ncbi:MAG: protein kinase [Planctomycetota bacterium]
MSEDASIITCRKCGSKLEATWSTCPSCGAPTSLPGLVCPNRNCQSPIEEHWKICPYCATTLSGSETPHANEASSGTGANLSSRGGIVTQRKNGRITIVPLDLPEGEALWDKYRIVKELGRGGFGAVYQVEDTVLNEQIALKVVVAGEGDVEHATEEIVHEFKLRSKVTDISHIINAQDPRTCKYKGLSLVLLPMDLADGGSLRQWLLHNQDVEKRLKTGLELFKQACLGVKAIHDADLVHLDIKPENILLVGGKAKIADFGIGRYCSKMFAKNPKQLLRRGVGTPQYMSPEQFRAARPKDIGRASDIYSLGIVLFEILDGSRPFEGDPLELQDAHLNIQPPLLTGKAETWWSIVKRCLEKDATDRYLNIVQLLKDLDYVAQGLPLSVDVACPNCGHANIKPGTIHTKKCEKCRKELPDSYFCLCPGCDKILRIDVEKCPVCDRNVAAYYRLLGQREYIEQLKDEDPAGTIELLEKVLQSFKKSGDEIGFHERAIQLLKDLRKKQTQITPLIDQARDAELDHQVEQAIEAWQEVLKIISRHRIAKGKIQDLKSRIKDFGQGRKKAVKLMNEAKFEDAEELLENCQKIIRDYENINEILKICRQRAKEYDEGFKGARKSLEQGLFQDAHEQIKIALTQAPESSEAKALSEQIDRVWSKSLIQEAPPKIKAAKFEETEALLDHAEKLCQATEELDEARKLLRETQYDYDEHMGHARDAKKYKDFVIALKNVDLAIEVCPDSKEARELKNDIAKLKKEREDARKIFRENVIAAAKWLFVLMPGIAGIVVLVLYTQLEIGGIAIGIGIMAGILNYIRKTGIYNALSNWDLIKGEARPAFFLISLLLAVSGALSVTNKPLTALIFPVLAVVYSFGKELKELAAIVAKGPVIRECRTQIGKVTAWWNQFSNRSKSIAIITALLLVVVVSAAAFVGTYQSKQRSEMMADISNAAASQVVGNWKEAAILYERLVAEKPNNLSFKNSLAICQYMVEAETAEREGRFDEALIHCQNAGDLATVPAIIEVIDTKIQDISDAKEKFDKITALLTEAQALKNEGDLDKSLGCVAKALTLDTDNVEAGQLHAELTSLMKRRVESEKQERFRNLMAKAVNYETQEDWEKAIEAYSQVMIIKPDNSDVKGKLAECYHNLNVAKAKEAENKGELNKAIGFYTKALSYKQVPSTQVALESAKEKQAKPDQSLSSPKTDDSDTMYQQGQMHENADGVRRNYQKAIECYREAAEAGHIGAMNRLGAMYYAGMGVPRNFNKAVEWHHKAIDMGNIGAMSNLGAIYMVNEYYEKAIKWYHKAIEAENSTAMHLLGMMYHEGAGVSKDYKKAMEWYRKAAEADNSTGMNSLGIMYKNGWGIAQNYQKAEEWFHKSAEKGNSDAMHNLGQMYRNGNGLRRDYQKAIEWYHKAAEAGDSDGMCSIGAMYYGGIGVVKDYKKAMEWYRKAAETGDSAAMHNLGVMHMAGEGVSINYQKAMECFRKAAEAGNIDAMNNLGAMYYDGRGVVKDHKKAMEWFRKAARLGDESAQQNLINFGETW